MTIRKAMERGIALLKSEGITTPKLKTRLLMQYILNKTRQELIVYDNQNLSNDLERNFFKAIELLRKKVPIEHITHQKEFMKLNFFVDENVLIPRADTEILVEESIKIAKRIGAKKILDLCTGSGAIAISLSKYIENSMITALDVSNKALEIAKLNSKRNGVENKIIFIESDMFNNMPNIKYDMIVSNPPYIKTETIKKLNDDVRKEPYIALDGGYDGLNFYREIVNNSYRFLKFGGYLCLEIGYNQKDEVIELIKEKEQYIDTYSLKDLCDNDRVIVTKVGG